MGREIKSNSAKARAQFFVCAVTLASLAFSAAPLSAACISPAGLEGETLYNTDYAVMQFCDGTNWVSMAASGTVTEADPQVNSLTGSAWCKANAGGTAIDCTTTALSASGSSGQIQFNNSGLFAGAAALTYATSGSLLSVTAQAATDKPLIVRAATSQSANIQEWQNSAGTALSSISSAGVFTGSGAGLTSLNASNLSTGTVGTARLGTGTASSSTFLRGDGTWAGVGASGTVSSGTIGQMAYYAATGTAVSGAVAVTYAASGNLLTVTAQAATDKPLIVKGAASQTANLLEAQNSAGTEVFSVSSGGTVTNALGMSVGTTLSVGSWAQIGTSLTVDTNTLFVDSTANRVGIGTITPTTTLDVVGAVTATSFSGSGASLTSLNASNLSTGTIPDARFPATLPAASGANLTALNATNLSTGTVGTGRLGTGTANSTTFLRGDGTWAGVGASGTVNSGTIGQMAYYAATGSALSGTPAAIYATSGNLFTVTAQAATDKPLIVKGAASQSANLMEVQNSAGTALVSVSSAGAITGSGSGLTALNASNLSTGTVPDARFPATLPAASGVNLTSLNATNLGSGTVPDARFPATLPAVSGANLTTLNASNLATGTVGTGRLGTGTANSTTFLRGDGTWTATSALATSPGGSTTQIQYNNAGAFAGAAAMTYATSGSLLTVTAQAATDKPLIVKGAASQSANLLEVQNSAATALVSVSSAGNVSTSGTLSVTGDVAVNTNKFNVTATSGNTAVGGTLSVTGATTLSNTLAVTAGTTLSNTLAVTGDVSVNTNKFNVTAASGNTAIAGTLGVTGASTLTGNVSAAGTITGATGVGVGTSTVAANAVVDLVSTTKGFFPPRMTTAQRDAIATPSGGLIVYNTTNSSLDVYYNSSWGSLGASRWSRSGNDISYTTGSVGIGTAAASVNASAVLDVFSTTKGLLPPRMTTTQRDAVASPAAGLTVYNTTTNALNVFNGTAWGAVGGASSVSTLTDVTLTSVANNDILRYNGSAWVNVPVANQMTTTTMVPSWPDAIVCTITGGTPAPAGRKVVFVNSSIESTGSVSYVWMGSGPNYWSWTFTSAGAYSGQYYNPGSIANTTNCDGLSITQLYAAGRAFNFIGTGAVTTFNVGTATAPGLAVTSDTDSGLFQGAANTLSLAAGGVEVLRGLNTASAVNYFTMTPSTGTNTVTLSADGTGATVPITIDAKGTSAITLVDATTFSGTTAHTGAASFSSTITGTTGVGVGTTAVAASALLDMVSTTRGLLPPRMTTANRDAIASPATGLTVYNTTTNALNVYNGTVWGAVGGGALSGLSDTTITSVANNDILQYNSGTSRWVNTPLVSAVAGAAGPSFSVHKNGTNQTGIAGATKLTWSTELFDTNNNFASDKFTPTVAGKYVFNIAGYCTDSTVNCLVYLYKNGALYQMGSFVTATQSQAISTLSTIVDMNGTTDYVEAFVAGATTVSGNLNYTYFSGGLLAPLASGTVAGTGTSGKLPVWTSGNALTNASALDYLASGNLLTVSALAATDKPLIVKGAASQSANLLEIQNSAATALVSVSSAGNVSTSGTLGVTGATTLSSTLAVTGNATFDTDTFKVDAANNRVGIGTATPVTQFEIVTGSEKVRIGHSSPVWGVDIKAATTGGWQRSYSFQDSSDAILGAFAGYGSANALSYLFVGTSYVSPWVTFMPNGAVGIGTNAPASTALLDITSTTKGFLPPRMTTTQRDAVASPATGLTVYNTTTNALNVYTGSSWAALGTGGGAASTFAAGTVSSPGLAVTTDTNTGFYQATADTLSVVANGIEVLRANTVASGVNYFNFTPAVASGQGPILAAAGSDTNVPLRINAKGTGAVTITSQDSGAIGLIVKSASTPTANMLEFHNSAGTALSLIDKDGDLVLGSASIAATAALEVVSTTKGFLPPRMTTTNRDAITSPATGLTVYNTTTNALNVYNGSAWGALGSAAPGGSTTQIQFNNAGAFGGAAALTYATSGTNLTVTASGAGVKPLVVKAAASQTADLFEVQDSNSSSLAVFGSSGTLTFPALSGMDNSTLINKNGISINDYDGPQVSLIPGGASTFSKGLEVNTSFTVSAPGALLYAGQLHGNVGIGTDAPASNAILDIVSTTKGFLPPRMTTTQRDAIAAPTAGMTIYNTTTNALNVRGTASWGALASASPGGSPTQIQFNNAGAFGGSAALVWDNATSRLGIGTASTSTSLVVFNNANSATYNEAAMFAVTNNAGGTNFSRLNIGQVSTNNMFIEAANQANTKGNLLLQPYGGNVGIGTVNPAFKLHVTGTETSTTGGRDQLSSVNLTITPTALSNEYYTASNVNSTLTGGFAVTGDIISTLNTLNHSGTSTLASGYAAYNALYNSSSGTTTSGVGAFNYVENQNTAGLVTTAIGGHNFISNARAAGVGISTGYGAYNVAQNTSTGQIVTAMGSFNQVLNFSTGTVSTGYGMLGRITNNSSGNIGTGYSAYLDMSNAGTMTNWYGLFIASRTGNTPSGARYPLYIEDTGDSYFAGNIGIGTTTIGQKLTVAGAIAAQSATGTGDVLYVGNDTKIVDIDVAHTLGIYGQSVATEAGLKLGSAGPTLYGKSSSLGIGSTNPAATLDVVGSIQYTGVLYDASDRRLKKDIAALADGSLEKILKMKPVTFRMKADPAALEYGFIAQEMEEIIPDLVKTAQDGNKTKSINYSGIIAPLVKAVQELKAMLDVVVTKLDAIMAKLTAHDEEMKALKDGLKAVLEENTALKTRLQLLEAKP